MIRALWTKDLDKHGINPQDLVLLDTSAIAFLCLCRSNYEKLLKNHPSDYFIRSQWGLARAIVGGELKNGAVTPVVFEELYGISHKKPFDKKVLLECLRKIKEDSKCQLYNIFIPKTEYERFPYLGEVLKEGKGEISIAITSIESGIPIIVSDDDDIFLVRTYLESQYRKAHFGLGKKSLSIIRSRDLCDLYKLKY